MSHYQNQGKKGLTEKIKEKIPGLGRKHNDPYQQGHTTSTTAPGYYEGQHHQGLTEKIKENIPGVGQGHTTSTTAPGHYKGQQHQQKKGCF
nr:dehydrin Rab18-like [Quercus suber]POF26789.1 hypothetical protein CFP56_47949 [Quercus suber]